MKKDFKDCSFKPKISQVSIEIALGSKVKNQLIEDFRRTDFTKPNYDINQSQSQASSANLVQRFYPVAGQIIHYN